jgi:hypothetical protein
VSTHSRQTATYPPAVTGALAVMWWLAGGAYPPPPRVYRGGVLAGMPGPLAAIARRLGWGGGPPRRASWRRRASRARRPQQVRNWLLRCPARSRAAPRFAAGGYRRVTGPGLPPPPRGRRAPTGLGKGGVLRTRARAPARTLARARTRLRSRTGTSAHARARAQPSTCGAVLPQLAAY